MKQKTNSPGQQALDPVDDADLGLPARASPAAGSVAVGFVVEGGPVVSLVCPAAARPHQAVLGQRRHRLDDRRPRRPVVVEEVAAEQHDVRFVLGREPEDLVEGREGVVLADLVLLPGAEVVVGGDEDAEDAVVGVVGGGVAVSSWLTEFFFPPRGGEVERGREVSMRKERRKPRRAKRKLSTILFFFFSLLSGSTGGPLVPSAEKSGPKTGLEEREKGEEKRQSEAMIRFDDRPSSIFFSFVETHSCLVPPPPPPPLPPPAQRGMLVDADRGIPGTRRRKKKFLSLAEALRKNERKVKKKVRRARFFTLSLSLSLSFQSQRALSEVKEKPCARSSLRGHECSALDVDCAAAGQPRVR